MLKTMQRGAQFARFKVREAVRQNKIQHQHVCELCGVDVNLLRRITRDDVRRPRITAHHYKGYTNPLDIWWICASCNRKLKHSDGIMTQEEARQRYGINRITPFSFMLQADHHLIESGKIVDVLKEYIPAHPECGFTLDDFRVLSGSHKI